MISCFCCLKKRGEVYLLRNARGIENHRNRHLRNSDEDIPEIAVERGEFDREEDRITFAGLQEWAAEQIPLRNRNIPLAHVPLAQNVVNSQIETESEML